ncbi:MAG: hypothetical protein P8L16_03530, partial [Ilumatobacter sp.]|nr:hypothetical protein [Ilumatobacter sp.]
CRSYRHHFGSSNNSNQLTCRPVGQRSDNQLWDFFESMLQINIAADIDILAVLGAISMAG